MSKNMILCFILFGIGPKWVRWIAWPIAGVCWLYALLLSG